MKVASISSNECVEAPSTSDSILIQLISYTNDANPVKNATASSNAAAPSPAPPRAARAAGPPPPPDHPPPPPPPPGGAPGLVGKKNPPPGSPGRGGVGADQARAHER